jgi:hypothetical protein
MGEFSRCRLLARLIVWACRTRLDADGVYRQRAFIVNGAGEDLQFHVSQAGRALLPANFRTEMPAGIARNGGRFDSCSGPSPMLPTFEPGNEPAAVFKLCSALVTFVPGTPTGLGALAGRREDQGSLRGSHDISVVNWQWAVTFRILDPGFRI